MGRRPNHEVTLRVQACIGEECDSVDATVGHPCRTLTLTPSPDPNLNLVPNPNIGIGLP